MPTAYDNACASIEGLTRFTKKNDGRHTRECLERLGNPDRDFAAVHVAGTNGKGSVCAMLASVLMEAGKRVGLFISPHLITTRERFVIDGADISEEEFVEAYDTVKAMTRTMENEGLPHPSYFEFLFLMGMVIFQRAHVDVVVLETGLGGRLDATNVVEKPDISVIASIGLDHTKYLGDTISQVAGEKAGIIKDGITVVYDDSEAEASAVIRARAGECRASAYAVNRRDMTHIAVDENGVSFTLETDGAEETYRVPIPALYEADNAALAVKTCRVLRLEKSFFYGDLTDDVIRSGLLKTKWPGRMERLEDRIYVDGAHNPAGVRALIETVGALPLVKSIDILFSVMGDKDYPTMIRELARALKPVHVTLTSISERSASAETLAALFADEGVSSITIEEDVASAYAAAREKAQTTEEGHYLFCLGSLYFAGELKACLK